MMGSGVQILLAAPFRLETRNRGADWGVSAQRPLEVRFPVDDLDFLVGNEDPVDNGAGPRLPGGNLASRQALA